MGFILQPWTKKTRIVVQQQTKNLWSSYPSNEKSCIVFKRAGLLFLNFKLSKMEANMQMYKYRQCK